MFGNSKNQKQEKSVAKPVSNPMAINSLVEGTSMEGHLSSKGDIRIDGKLSGTLECQGKVIIGPSGLIEGDVICKTAVIEGKFEGKLEVEDTLQVREDAMINGDVTTGKLIVQSGAVFNVTCKMGGQTLGDFQNGRQKQTSKQKQKAEIQV
jgi:cytoskeletal protein CcmA (bactofilin family)